MMLKMSMFMYQILLFLYFSPGFPSFSDRKKCPPPCAGGRFQDPGAAPAQRRGAACVAFAAVAGGAARTWGFLLRIFGKNPEIPHETWSFGKIQGENHGGHWKNQMGNL